MFAPRGNPDHLKDAAAEMVERLESMVVHIGKTGCRDNGLSVRIVQIVLSGRWQ